MSETNESMETSIEQDVTALESISAQLSWIGRRRLEQELDAYQLTVPQYMALRSIQERSGECNMTHLAQATYQVTPTMTGIIDRLTERGLVRREANPRDRRALCVVLTPEGRNLLEQIRSSRSAVIHRFLNELSQTERRSMIDMARRYLAVMERSILPE